jgi:3-dehydroquinate synthase
MQERRITLDLGDRSYPIIIGEGAWSAPELGEQTRNRRVLVVTNDVVAPLYLERLTAQLIGVDHQSLILPDGEQFKTLATLETLFDTLLRGRFDRTSVLVALGGGVIGDLVGFAAATYQRGIDFIQIPTTLLAQVDSSVGGKTAVNHPLGKNMIGAFYQPRSVLIDVSTLTTLPDREFSAGMAEVIKYGLIRDADFFSWLETHIDALMARNTELLCQAIEVSCQTKAEVVAADERERDVRAILNLGHTFGHAIEAAQHYRDWLHGEAVGAGMAMAARLSRIMGQLDDQEISRIERLLTAAGLPLYPPADLSAEQLRDLMGYDKKVSHGKLRLVLLERIGQACVTADFDEQDLMLSLRAS